jgi:hypothetical protein
VKGCTRFSLILPTMHATQYRVVSGANPAVLQAVIPAITLQDRAYFPSTAEHLLQ